MWELLRKNLYENNKDLYNAVCKALDEAMQYVKNNPEETAQLVKDKLELDDSVEDIVKVDDLNSKIQSIFNNTTWV